MHIESETGLVLVTYGALFFVGFAYNAFVHFMQESGYAEGYTSILVIGGVSFTLAGLAIVDLHAASMALWAFAASGFWMVVGSMYRHIQHRENGKRGIRDEVDRE